MAEINPLNRSVEKPLYLLYNCTEAGKSDTKKTPDVQGRFEAGEAGKREGGVGKILEIGRAHV